MLMTLLSLKAVNATRNSAPRCTSSALWEDEQGIAHNLVKLLHWSAGGSSELKEPVEGYGLEKSIKNTQNV